jgi:hypothetical protein
MIYISFYIWCFITLRRKRERETEKVSNKITDGITKYHAKKTHRGNGGTAPRILNLGTKWR